MKVQLQVRGHQMATFTNSTGLTILDNTIVSQTIVVSGLSGPITDIQVVLNDLTHTFPDDLTCH